MTVASETRSVEYNGNGATTVFPYSFRIFAQSDLRVTLIDEDDVATVQTISTHYTVSGANNPNGGNVTMLTAPATGERLVIEIRLPLLQPTDIKNQGAFYPQIHEDQFDRACRQIQQIAADAGSSLRYPTGFTDRWDANNKRIINLADGVDEGDAVNKGQLDAAVTAAASGTSRTVWTFTGDGSTTDFSLPGRTMSSPASFDVFISGVRQTPVTDYGIDASNNQIEFTSAPPVTAANQILVVETGFSANTSSADQLRTDLAASTGSSLVGAYLGYGAATTVQNALRIRLKLFPTPAPADSTSEFQAAIAYAVATFGTGCVIEIPAGEFWCNVDSRYSEVVFEGQGSAATTVRNYADAPAFKFSNADRSIRNFGLRNMYVRNRDSAVYTSADGLYIDGSTSPSSRECDFPIVENVEFFQFRDNISINGRCIWGTWRNVNAITAIRDGVHVEASNNCAVHTWDMCRIANNGRYGLYVNHTFTSLLLCNWSLRTCTFENNQSVPVYLTGTQGVQNFDIENCYFEENTQALLPSGGSGIIKAYLLVDCPYAFGLNVERVSFFGRAAPAADPDYYIYVADTVVNVAGKVDLCRFDTAVINAIYWKNNVYIGKNSGSVGVPTIDRSTGSILLGDITGASDDWASAGGSAPAIAFGGAAVGVVYTNQVSRYARHGNWVFFSCYIAISSKGSSTGALTINGLPQASVNVTNMIHAAAIGFDGWASAPANVQIRFSPNTTTLQVKYNSAGTLTNIDNTHLNNASSLYVSGCYPVR